MDDPISHIDPDGKDGDVEVTKDEIKIKVQIYIFGSGASDEQALKMQKAIMEDWNKGFSYTHAETEEKYMVHFDVKVQVYDKDNPQNGPGLFSGKNNPFSTSNFIEVGATSKDVSRSFVRGGDEGKWRGYGTDPSSHEFGHLIGLKDHYSDAKGANPGWNGNVMAEVAGQGHVEQKNIDALVTPIINEYHKSIEYLFNKRSANYAWKYKTTIDEPNPNW